MEDCAQSTAAGHRWQEHQGKKEVLENFTPQVTSRYQTMPALDQTTVQCVEERFSDDTGKKKQSQDREVGDLQHPLKCIVRTFLSTF